MTPGQPKAIHTRQLAVDMYDSAKHSLVWRALVSKTIDPKSKPEKRQKNLQKAPAKLMKAYPPVYPSDPTPPSRTMRELHMSCTRPRWRADAHKMLCGLPIAVRGRAAN
jgi:hypothetical protein